MARAVLILTVFWGQTLVGLTEFSHVYWQLDILERRKVLFSRGRRIFETALKHPAVDSRRFLHVRSTSLPGAGHEVQEIGVAQRR